MRVLEKNEQGETLQAQPDAIEVEILIVGFGFSAVPLVRELDLGNTSYTIICERNSIWDKLASAEKLDFDLVSSYYTSFYSFDLVQDLKGDVFPTAREFYDIYVKNYDLYKEKIQCDFVESIENHEAFNLVRTRQGQTYKASHVVISTAYRRKILNELLEFDYDISNKTILFNAFGDSANLLISKLVPGNNKVICLHNGVVPVDKIMSLHGTTFTLDQLEFHNFGHHFRRTYRNLVGGGICPFNIVINPLAKLLQLTFLSRLFCRHNLQERYKLVRKHVLTQFPAAPMPNGVIAVKYWPIDKYAEEFSDQLDEAIEQGYLLNDIAFFVSENLVDMWPRNDSKIDTTNKTVTCNGQTESYDHFIESDTESPNLPKIVVVRNKRESDFEYQYRENYYGVVPSELSNVYFLGLTRPTTGGLANITEMQCLLVHKMLTSVEFRHDIRTQLKDRIAEYNRSHYLDRNAGRADHVVWYGSYTEEIAQILNINIKLRDCRSFDAINKYFFFPNNAFKYRQSGEYRVEGCGRLVDYIYQDHKKYRYLHYYVLTFLLYRLLFFEYTVLLYVEDIITLPVFFVVVFLQILLAKIFVVPAQNYFGKLKLSYLSMGAIAMAFLGSKVFIPLMVADFAYTYYVRQKGFRHLFNDLKNKPRYRDFFKRYLQIYLSVRDKRAE